MVGSVVSGTADELRRAAAGVQGIGDDVRRLAVSVLELASVTWESSAAAEFRRRVGAEAARVRVAADRVDDAALALRRHAFAVDRVVAEVPRDEGRLRRAVAGEVGRLAGGIESLAGGVAGRVAGGGE